MLSSVAAASASDFAAAAALLGAGNFFTSSGTKMNYYVKLMNAVKFKGLNLCHQKILKWYWRAALTFIMSIFLHLSK